MVCKAATNVCLKIESDTKPGHSRVIPIEANTRWGISLCSTYIIIQRKLCVAIEVSQLSCNSAVNSS